MYRLTFSSRINNGTDESATPFAKHLGAPSRALFRLLFSFSPHPSSSLLLFHRKILRELRSDIIFGLATPPNFSLPQSSAKSRLPPHIVSTKGNRPLKNPRWVLERGNILRRKTRIVITI